MTTTSTAPLPITEPDSEHASHVKVTPPMDPNVKALWLNALRSGQYAQGTAGLASKYEGQAPSFCCLGVLCEVAVQQGLEIPVKDDTSFRDYDGEVSILPASVARWAGLAHRNPVVPVNSQYTTQGRAALAEHNDQGSSFATIADLIEENL